MIVPQPVPFHSDWRMISGRNHAGSARKSTWWPSSEDATFVIGPGSRPKRRKVSDATIVHDRKCGM